MILGGLLHEKGFYDHAGTADQEIRSGRVIRAGRREIYRLQETYEKQRGDQEWFRLSVII